MPFTDTEAVTNLMFLMLQLHHLVFSFGVILLMCHKLYQNLLGCVSALPQAGFVVTVIFSIVVSACFQDGALNKIVN